MSECVNDLTDRASESIRMEVTDDEECKLCTRLESLLMTSPVLADVIFCDELISVWRLLLLLGLT